VRLVQEHPDWAEYAGVDWLAGIMTVSATDREHRKQGRAIGRWTLSHPARPPLVVFLKRHFQLPWLHRLLSRLMPKRAWSPGLQEWQHLHWAKQNKLPVPEVLAGGELRTPGLGLQSFLVLKELDQQEPLHIAVPMAEAKLAEEEFADWKRGLMIELARLCRELHQRNHYHKDLYYCHFYVNHKDIETVPSQWTNCVTMIDFHRLQKHHFARPWHLIKDLAQLLYSSNVPGMTDADRQLFWQEYRSGNWGGTTPPAAWLLRFIRWKAGRYQAHHDRKQARRATLQPAAP
jgi:hypothetical protein